MLMKKCSQGGLVPEKETLAVSLITLVQELVCSYFVDLK